MRKIFIVILLGTAFAGGCGDEADELEPVEGTELPAALAEAQTKLERAGFHVEGGDLDVYGSKDVPALLVNTDSDAAFAVFEQGKQGPNLDAQPPGNVVQIKTSFLCNGLEVAGPDGPTLKDAMKQAQLCPKEFPE